jgi:hypothetical protein
MSKRGREYDPDELRDIVNNLISGSSLSRVPAEFHSFLLVPLSAAKNEAIVAGNTLLVKRLQTLMQELQLNPGKALTTSRRRQRSQSAFITSRTLKDEKHDDVQVTIDELLEGRDIETIDGSELPRLIPALKDRKQIAITRGDYRQSQQLEDLIQAGNSRHYERTYQSLQNSRLTALRVQLMKANEDLQSAEEFWAKAKEEHDEEYNANLDSMNDQQRQQLDDLDASFPDSLPAKFAKLSPHVLNLREQEKHLVLSKRYEDAIPIRERADRLEEDELERQRRKFMNAFETRRRQLSDAHNTQRRCFDRNWGRKLERFESERDHDLDVLKRTIANFEARIEAIENDTEIATTGVISKQTPRSSSRATPPTTRTPSRAAPPDMNARVRNVAASNINRKPRVRRVGLVSPSV